MSWDWFVFSVNWHCQHHHVSAVTYTGCCGILNMFFLCWVSTNIHSWHPLAWLVIDSLTGTGQWGKMHIGFRLCAGRCCHPLFDTVAAEWECVEENDSSHLAAFGPYSAVRMDLILTVLADGILYHRRTRCAFMPPPQPSAHPSPPFSPSPHPTSSTRSGSGREWGSAPRPSHLRYRFIYAFLTHMKHCVMWLLVLVQLSMVEHFDLISMFFSLRLLHCQWELLKLFLTTACSEPYTCIPVSVCLTSFQGHLGSTW